MESSDNQITTCDDCMVCLCQMDVPSDTITTTCGHIFHMECISIWYDKQTNVFNCPACRESLKSTPKIIYDIPDSNNTLCTYFNGDTLEGVRENGEFIGQCKQTDVDGTFLEGERKNGEFIGQCKQTDVDGTFLEGEWKNGEFIGQCKEADVDGIFLEGEMKNGEFIGQCKYTFVCGTFLEGERKNGEFIGQCKQTWVDGTFLEGEWKNGQFIGQCKQTYVDGTFLEGERKNGQFIGQCKETYVRHNITRVRECEVKNRMFKYKLKCHIGTPVFQYDTKSRLINRFDSIKSCAKSLKTGRHQITKRLNGVKCRDTALYPANYYLNQYVFSTTKI